MAAEYDQIKLKEIDQLHAAILQFSENTLTTKKFCATVLIAVVTVILKITANNLDPAIYVGGITTILIFWVIDANSYYYQRKLRIRMKKIVAKMTQDQILDGLGVPLTKDEETNSWKGALFNYSQLFYLLAFAALLITFICDIIGWI